MSASPQTDTVVLFSLKTRQGEFYIEADRAAFKITYTFEKEPFLYALRCDTFPGYVKRFDSPYHAIRAVAEHATGIPEWDASKDRASDYAPDWTRHIDKRLRMRLVSDFLAARPHASARELVDYCEHRHGYMIDRLDIKTLLKELVMNGDLTELPSMVLAPAEFWTLQQWFKTWQNPVKEE